MRVGHWMRYLFERKDFERPMTWFPSLYKIHRESSKSSNNLSTYGCMDCNPPVWILFSQEMNGWGLINSNHASSERSVQITRWFILITGWMILSIQKYVSKNEIVVRQWSQKSFIFLSLLLFNIALALILFPLAVWWIRAPQRLRSNRCLAVRFARLPIFRCCRLTRWTITCRALTSRREWGCAFDMTFATRPPYSRFPRHSRPEQIVIRDGRIYREMTIPY
jgi:hypothetical protein